MNLIHLTRCPSSSRQSWETGATILTSLSYKAKEALPTVFPNMTEVVWIPKPTAQTTGQAIEVDEAVVERESALERSLMWRSGSPFNRSTPRMRGNRSKTTWRQFLDADRAYRCTTSRWHSANILSQDRQRRTWHEHAERRVPWMQNVACIYTWHVNLPISYRQQADFVRRLEGIPRPIDWGTYKSDPNKHFYLAEFMEMTADLPDIRAFSAMLAKLHHDSMTDPKAPNKFGYHVMTHEGSMYQDITWTKTWEKLYSQRFQSFVDQELASQGPSGEIERLVLDLKKKVIPRLLRPLDTHGRKLRPVALHGDIWCGNIGTNAVTGEPMYFDPAVFWGHNECK